MQTIDLAKIINDLKLDKAEVAAQLFPKNNHPKLALKRILSGEAVLDANQISKLSLLTGLTVGQLYGVGDWKYEINNGIYTLTSGDFKAVLNTETWQTKVFHRDSLFHDEVIHAGTTTLSEYVNKLNAIITKYSKNEKSTD